MPSCVLVQAATLSGPGQASNVASHNVLPWVYSDAIFDGGVYSCATGAHMLMTVAEYNAMPKSGVPDAQLMRESFFMSFGLVLSCYLIGKLAGAVLHVIRRG